MRFFYVFPINRNKVFFSSYEGAQFSCNPKYVFEYLRKEKPNLDYVYEYNDLENPPKGLKGVKLVKHNSFQYFKELLTSRVVITNSGVSGKIPIRKSQVNINTWHAGGAYKKQGKDIDSKINGANSVQIDYSSMQTDYFITCCKAQEDVMFSSLGIAYSKMKRFGMARNDIFFKSQIEKSKIINKVRKKFAISEDQKVVLYAPTYRGGLGNTTGINGENLDPQRLIDTLEKQFGGSWILMYRGHYHSNSPFLKGKIMDGSKYPDMQELLLLSDILITDYSSSIWDYSYMDKPCFLFTPDIKKYEGERDFYCPISKWPYPYAQSNDELESIIIGYQQSDQMKKNNLHHKELGDYQGAAASKLLSDFVLTHINRRIK